MSAHQFGLGEAVIFGFDLAAALPPEMERSQLRGYLRHRKVFQRSGKAGGVPGLDF